MADDLTKTQRIVYNLMIEGFSNLDIGERTFTTEKSVKFHITDIFKKCQVSSRAELIARHYKRQMEARELQLKTAHAIEIDALQAKIYRLEQMVVRDELPGRPLRGA